MKNNLMRLISILIFSFFLFQSCRKEPGIGGDAKIYGKVYYKHYNSTFTTLINEGYLSDTYVYIVYGDDVNYGQRIKTNYKGEFEFNYLYRGKYTIYTYSIDSLALVSGQLPISEKAVIQTIEISDRREQRNLDDLIVYK
ncbi:MAG TPA: hypothetical protein DEF82_05100 [Crocinitomicaceae bacterium]|nr:hypothetical protein [Flavobacteriales bacterium]HBW86121.1 hypothetical protein [Crocinitomicaceae bacterium]